MFTKKFIIIMVVIIGVLLVFIAGLLLWKNFSVSFLSDKNVNAPIVQTPEESLRAGKEATGNLIEETKKLADGIDQDKIAQVVTVNRNDSEGAEEAVMVAPQSNPISVADGEVLTRSGEEAAKSETRAGDTDAPLQSAPIDVDKLPASAIELNMSSTAITPAEFTVHAGQAVALAVTAENSVEVFKFEDPALAAVAVGLEPQQTRVITFKAPTILGEYVFYSDFPGHRQAGAVGKMIVR